MRRLLLTGRAVADGGLYGRLLWGFYLAAKVDGYQLTTDETRVVTLSGRLVEPDSFKLQQRPLMFEVPHADGIWRWPMVTLTRTDDRLTATLGPLEGSATWNASSAQTSGH